MNSYACVNSSSYKFLMQAMFLTTMKTPTVFQNRKDGSKIINEDKTYMLMHV